VHHRRDGHVVPRWCTLALIEDYAMVGDLQTAALVGRDGSIDWLCLPRFDSGACFAALLGDEHNGRWLLAPAGGVRRVTRRYRPGTLILETLFETEDGDVRLVDFMPPRGRDPDVVRIVEGVRGSVEMDMRLAIRLDYGAVVPWVRRRGDALLAVAGPDALALHTPAELRGEDMQTRASFRVREGDRVPFVLTWFPSHHDRPAAVDPEVALAETVEYWHQWSSRFEHDGPLRDEILSSLVVLKALTYEPTGGLVAAATTSLPEDIGGVRNWDYRYCWLRDATLTLLALVNCGYGEEARRFRDWLARALAGDPGKLQIMYGLAGERRLPELELGWLAGYEGSRPVRTGNAASVQLQLDVYGEVLDAFYQARRAGMPRSRSAWSLQRKLLEFLESRWDEPDEGIWEVRGPRRHFTHSKVMAWVAFDRAVKAVETQGLDGPADRWRRLRAEVHDDVCRRGYDAGLGSFVQSYGTRALDASLLLIPNVGFLPADDPRVRGTVEAVRSRLCEDGFVLRYQTEGGVDGLPGSEGAFLACTFWLVDALAQTDRLAEARELFDKLLAIRNDVGLLAEEYDTGQRRQVGNVPQAFSHIGLVNSALNLARGGAGPAAERCATE
jgi:GH15 family glucan-1,4-alpha-glucosidase